MWRVAACCGAPPRCSFMSILLSSRFWPPTQESYESESASEAGVIGAFGGSG